MTGHPPVADGWEEAVLPPEAGPLMISQAAEAEEITGAVGAEATASPSEATASPREAAGCPECPEEAARTGAEGAAGPSEHLMRIRHFSLLCFFLFQPLICCTFCLLPFLKKKKLVCVVKYI